MDTRQDSFTFEADFKQFDTQFDDSNNTLLESEQDQHKKSDFATEFSWGDDPPSFPSVSGGDYVATSINKVTNQEIGQDDPETEDFAALEAAFLRATKKAKRHKVDDDDDDEDDDDNDDNDDDVVGEEEEEDEERSFRGHVFGRQEREREKEREKTVKRTDDKVVNMAKEEKTAPKESFSFEANFDDFVSEVNPTNDFHQPPPFSPPSLSPTPLQPENTEINEEINNNPDINDNALNNENSFFDGQFEFSEFEEASSSSATTAITSAEAISVATPSSDNWRKEADWSGKVATTTPQITTSTPGKLEEISLDITLIENIFKDAFEIPSSEVIEPVPISSKFQENPTEISFHELVRKSFNLPSKPLQQRPQALLSSSETVEALIPHITATLKKSLKIPETPVTPSPSLSLSRSRPQQSQQISSSSSPSSSPIISPTPSPPGTRPKGVSQASNQVPPHRTASAPATIAVPQPTTTTSSSSSSTSSRSDESSSSVGQAFMNLWSSVHKFTSFGTSPPPTNTNTSSTSSSQPKKIPSSSTKPSTGGKGGNNLINFSSDSITTETTSPPPFFDLLSSSPPSVGGSGTSTTGTNYGVNKSGTENKVPTQVIPDLTDLGKDDGSRPFVATQLSGSRDLLGMDDFFQSDSNNKQPPSDKVNEILDLSLLVSNRS
eukprot:TRINITY_DN2180_c0_g1_i1.p1 TRINITY_DN2180_c0_g1~~TRINITY_DN2180_c0_g1_i1.p1  ORF type:complete len:665 (-),score=197.13 TRINITY_DN2180_c0_g1_i1:1078-3072(-)